MLPVDSPLLLKGLATGRPRRGKRMAPVMDVVEPRAKPSPAGALCRFRLAARGGGARPHPVLSGLAADRPPCTGQEAWWT